jgi:hypothetical protein
MRRFILAATAIAAFTVPALAPALASADVQRYQTQTATFAWTQPAGQVSQWDNVWTHSYTITVNPCDNTFSGTGTLSGFDQNFVDPTIIPETITGTLNSGSVSFRANNSYFAYMLDNAPMDGKSVRLATTYPVVPNIVEVKVSPLANIVSTDYKNHGDYVSSQGGGADAAHSCIGMPINSSK